jgi:uncharacterized protein (DUF1778 family)
MTSSPISRVPRDRTMNIRLSQSQKNLIDRAANCLGKNRSDFLLEVACREAENVLLDRAYIAVSDETFDNFCQMLDQPPQPSPGLLKLMQIKAPWS